MKERILGILPDEMPETVDECKKLFKATRDFDLYLDMLDRLKSRYLIILCLKNTGEQNFSEETVERIHKLGFSSFSAEPDMKYMGIFNSGEVLCDYLTGAYDSSMIYDVSLPKAELHISFVGKEAEIKINGEDQSLNDKGINIVVCDSKTLETIDVCSCDGAYENPALYHRNFYYDKKYIDTHIYMPESYIESVTLPMRRSYFSPRGLRVREVERGVFLPSKTFKVCGDGKEPDDIDMTSDERMTYGGICDESFSLIAGHQVFEPDNSNMSGRHISGTYVVEPEEITYIDEIVLYGGSLFDHPGHLITECFADRLWWLADNPDSDIKIAVQIVKNDEFSLSNTFVMEFFDALGIPNERLIIVNKPTQFKKIIIPDQSSLPLNYCFPYDFTPAYARLFRHMTNRLTPGKHKKIYLTKSKTHNKSTVGEEYFIDFFRQKGFEIIDPEDYTVKEKAELMYGADEVVTIDGTSSLFTVFCKPTARLTILARRMTCWDTPQQLITEAMGIKDFFLVNVSGNFLDGFSQNTFANYTRGMTFTYASREFAKYVKYVYNEEPDITPEESLKKHLFDYLTYFPEYYTNEINFINGLSFIKITDIVQSMSQVFLGKKFDDSKIVLADEDSWRIIRLETRIRKNNEANAKKIEQLTEKAKEFIDEITALKKVIAQRDAEIEQLRKSNAELTSYMAEVSQLLDALEAGNE